MTYWEIFSGGKFPYGGVTPMSLPKILQEGYQMEKPNNTACSKKRTLTKQALIYVCYSNPTYCTMLYDLGSHPFLIYRYESIML